MHNRQMPLVPEWLERLHCRMQSEKPIQIDHLILLNRNRRPHLVVSILAMGHNNVQPVRRPALKNDNQLLTLCLRRGCLSKNGSRQKARNRGRPHDGHCAALHQRPSRNRHETGSCKKTPSVAKTSRLRKLRTTAFICSRIHHPVTVPHIPPKESRGVYVQPAS